MSVANPDNIQAMRHHLLPHLPTDTDPEAVAIFPRSTSTQSTAMEIDVFINPYAAELLRTNKEMLQELKSVRVELQKTNALHATELVALTTATTDLRDTRLELGVLKSDRLHRSRLLKPKAMLGILGWLARDWCKSGTWVPAGSYGTKLTGLLDHPGKFPETLANEISDHPDISKYFNKNAIAKIDSAASVAARDNDAHMENTPIPLLSTLLELEQSAHESGMFLPGEEGAELAALRLMLARLGNSKAKQYLEEIKSDPLKYCPLAAGQEERFAKFL